jgi:hypothetical protein
MMLWAARPDLCNWRRRARARIANLEKLAEVLGEWAGSQSGPVALVLQAPDAIRGPQRFWLARRPQKAWGLICVLGA